MGNGPCQPTENQPLKSRNPLLWAGCLVVFGVYLLTIAPTVFWRDSAEFAMIPFNLDIGHPAGSPTYTLVAGLLARLPLGSIAFRSNLASACLGALAFLAYVFAARSLLRIAAPKVSDAVATAIGVACIAPLMFSPGLWYWTVAAEVYTGMMAVIALAIGLTMRHRVDGTSLSLRDLLALGLLLGLGCGMHMVIILFTPAVGVYLFFTRRDDFSVGAIAALLAAFLIGFSVFVLLPIRSATHPPFDFGHPETFSALLAHITGRKYTEVLQSFPWIRIGANLSTLPGHIAAHLSRVHLVLAGLGLILLVIRQWRIALFLGLLTLGHFYLYARDWNADFGYLPIYLFAALAAAVAVGQFAGYLEQRFPNSRRALVTGIVCCALLSGAWQARANRAHCDRTGHDLLLRQTRSILDSMPPDALLVSFEDHINYASVYTQSIERWREDVVHFHRAYLGAPDLLGERFVDLDVTALDGKSRSVYRFLMANAQDHPPFWDAGWESNDWIESDRLAPYGRLTQVLANPVEDLDAAAMRSEAIFDRTLGPILRDPLFNREDWTAIEVTTRFYSGRAKYYFDRNAQERARVFVEKALALRPDFAPLFGQQAALFVFGKNPEAALRTLDKGLGLDPLNVDLWNMKGQLAGQLERPGIVTESYRRSLDLNKKQVPVIHALSRELYGQGAYVQAEQIARDGLVYANDAQWIARLHELVALSLIQQGRFSQAKHFLLELLGEKPVDERLKSLLAICEQKEQNQ